MRRFVNYNEYRIQHEQGDVMKTHLSLCLMISFLTVGVGCAHAYVPGRYYQTTYTPAPLVYTTQPVVTYRAPVYQYASRRSGDVDVRVDEIARQVNRQVAEIEAQVRRQMEELEVKIRRETEAMERRFAQEMQTTRQDMERSVWRPVQTTTNEAEDLEPPCCSENDGDSRLDTAVTKLREWWTTATGYLQTAPWWVWAIGVALLFVVVFLISLRDAYDRPVQPLRQTQPRRPVQPQRPVRPQRPFQARNANPWVVDPADNY